MKRLISYIHHLPYILRSEAVFCKFTINAAYLLVEQSGTLAARGRDIRRERQSSRNPASTAPPSAQRGNLW
jgi:hypothetical protein